MYVWFLVSPRQKGQGIRERKNPFFLHVRYETDFVSFKLSTVNVNNNIQFCRKNWQKNW